MIQLAKKAVKINVKSLSPPQLGSRLQRRVSGAVEKKEGGGVGRERKGAGGRGAGEKNKAPELYGVKAQRPLRNSTPQKDLRSIKKLVKYIYSS